MSGRAFLIVKLAALGDVLLATAMAAALRRAHPRARIAWLTTAYAAPLLEANSDLDEVLLVDGAWGTWAAVRAWRKRNAGARVLLAHRSGRLWGLARAAGFRRGEVLAWGRTVGYDPLRHRLGQYTEMLAACGVEATEKTLAPALHLRWDELAFGEAWWSHAAAGQARVVVAPGGAENPWSAMPNRRWGAERYLELGRRARAAGAALCWLGGPGDAGLVAGLAAALPEGGRTACTDLALRRAAAVVGAADVVVGNDSLPLVVAQALRRPAVGVYGPTAGARIHAPGQPWVQGMAGCGPCYDPREGRRGRAYTCRAARCMEAVAVERVWREAAVYLESGARAAHA